VSFQYVIPPRLRRVAHSCAMRLLVKIWKPTAELWGTLARSERIRKTKPENEFIRNPYKHSYAAEERQMYLRRDKLALIGGILIVASGLVSIWVGGRAGYMMYQPDPNGLFGHVGVLAGFAAILIGCVLVWIALHEPAGSPGKVVVGLLTMVLGHLGAITGALLVGTAGLILCYVTGIWLVVKGLIEWRR